MNICTGGLSAACFPIWERAFFNTLIGLRTRRNKGKLTKEEKEFVREHSELIELEERNSKAAEDFISKIGRRGK